MKGIGIYRVIILSDNYVLPLPVGLFIVLYSPFSWCAQA